MRSGERGRVGSRVRNVRRGVGSHTPSVILIVILVHDLQAKVANADHPIVPKSMALDYVGSTSRAKDLATDPTMVLASPCGKDRFTVVAFFAILISHPVCFVQPFSPESSDDFRHAILAVNTSSAGFDRPNASSVVRDGESRNVGII